MLAGLVDPDFQRVNITGEDNTGVPVEDLQTASTLLVRALAIRQKYMQHSHQEFPTNVNRSDNVTFMRYNINRYQANFSKCTMHING